MKSNYTSIFLISALSLILLSISSSCGNLNSNVMFKIPKKSNFKYDSIPEKQATDYRISSGDRFSFLFSTNNGEKIIFGQSGIDNASGNSQQLQSNSNSRDYLVRQDGTAELPLVGIIHVAGLSIVELEDELTKKLSKNYIDPFVQIRVTNQRVLVFPGKGTAQVVYLVNTNTSLLEVLALSGGIREEARANSIKLIRKVNGKREIYSIDLSSIAGLKSAEMLVESNDYIYIDTKPRVASTVLKEIGPWLSVFTSSFAIYALIIK